MQPKFADELAWQQAEFLMQPIYIRIIDRIRQQSETSTWQVSYEEIRDPHPINYLCLKSANRQLKFDIWDLCYQVCFLDYDGSHSEIESQIVAVDTSLIDMEAQTPDWHRLDEKAKNVVARVFNNLPT
ncbi:hypothetical protein [Chamaesiphon sp. VAR_48_metabat_403]|uniref:hypothetical protein n=1 Tax=Chamaesiphon sp. VAR_48_metabat_403 TaxID=2964700 RepID=UPI00286DDB39|nr:hypothetical protein [Chamaesiphon sp. VAR_48_metabat_403]